MSHAPALTNRPERGAYHRPPRSFPPGLPRERIRIVAPPQLPGPQFGAWIQIGLAVLGSLGMVAFAVVMPSTAFLVISGVFVVMALLTALGNHLGQRRSGRLSARAARERYREHLRERVEVLQSLHARQRATDERLYPDPTGLASVVDHRRFMWERRPADSDFMHFRLGRAAVPLACGVELALEENPLARYEPDLLEEATAIARTFATIPDLALVESFADSAVITLHGPRQPALALARALIAQVAAFRAPGELRVMARFDPAQAAEWNWLKWLPHARAAGRGRGNGTPRLLLAAGDRQLAALLDAHVQPRLEQLRRIDASGGAGAGGPEIDAPELIVFLDGYHAGSDIARLGLLREITTQGTRLKTRMVAIVGPGDAEPPEAALRLLLSGDGRELTVERTGPSGYRIGSVVPDQLSVANADRIARTLTPLSLQESAGTIDLAEEIRLSWLRGVPTSPLSAPVGLADDGSVVVLDIREAAHGGMGPHGLLVGATGSGKSELLRTLVASLASRHAPEDLAFVFVDFKGGAAFAELAKLPHAAGMITNLQHDLTLIDRMQAALFGEIARRQLLLRQAGNLDDLAAYNALRASGAKLLPLPHLVMIVDEFGELLANRPEFLDLFLTIGRVGRSLGIHLLLSSQRLEEGRLKGLEGHLRYRLSLRTYSAQESKTVLGTADAFLLPPHPGVGFLSVDADVYQRFKTALVSAPAAPEGEDQLQRGLVAPFDLQADPGGDPLALAGAHRVGPPGSPADPGADGARRGARPRASELDVLVAELRETYRDSAGVHQVWLAPLPSKLSLDAVTATATAARTGDAPALVACLGLADLPELQRQEPMIVDLSGSGGHLALIGAPQSGKSTALRTLLVSLMASHTPDQLRAYLLDFGGGTLRGLAGAPHIGDVAGKGDLERTAGTVRHVRALLGERERRYRELGVEAIAEARARAAELGPDLASDVLLVIDDFGALIRDHEAVLDDIIEIAASGLHHGVHLIVTSGRWGDIRPNLRDAFGTRIETHLNDPLESDFPRKVAALIAPGLPGRAVTSTGRLFQVALPRLDGVADSDGLAGALSAFTATLRERWDGPCPSPIGVLPERVDLAELAGAATAAETGTDGPHRDGGRAPAAAPAIGLAELTLAPVSLELGSVDPHVLILGEPEAGRTEALRTLAHALSCQHAAGARLLVLDLRRQLEDLTALPLPCRYVSRPPQIAEALDQVREVCAQRINGDPAGGDPAEPIIILIDDYDLLAGAVGAGLAPLADIVFQGRDSGIFVIAATVANSGARLQTDRVTGRMLEAGATALILSGDPHDGPLVRGIRARPLPPGRAQLLRRRHAPVLIQLALCAHPAPVRS